MENKRPQLFDPEDDSGKILLNWWKELEERRGDRAELRRADNPTEVVFSQAYHRFYQRVRLPKKEELALIAGLCAHVKDHSAVAGIAEQMAMGQDKAAVSGLRFRRVLAISDRDDLYHAMIRIIRLLGGAVNIYDLAKSMYWWNDERWKMKQNWAYKYYEHAKDEK